MKVNIYETVEITDEQRVTLANVLDGKVNKPKRQATRDEIKAFVWDEGSGWETALVEQANDLAADTGTEEAPADEDEDLLGDDEDLI